MASMEVAMEQLREENRVLRLLLSGVYDELAKLNGSKKETGKGSGKHSVTTVNEDKVAAATTPGVPRGRWKKKGKSAASSSNSSPEQSLAQKTATEYKEHGWKTVKGSSKPKAGSKDDEPKTCDKLLKEHWSVEQVAVTDLNSTRTGVAFATKWKAKPSSHVHLQIALSVHG